MRRTEKTFIQLRMGNNHATSMAGIQILAAGHIDVF